MFQTLVQYAAWLALPVALLCIVDDWFLRPGRAAAAGAEPADGPLMKVLYGLLPLLILAAVYRMLTAERADFSLVLVVITALSGVVWAIDALLLRPRREAALRAAGRDPAAFADPGTVDYARSFFPVAAVLLVLRAFLFEPYRIPGFLKFNSRPFNYISGQESFNTCWYCHMVTSFLYLF